MTNLEWILLIVAVGAVLTTMFAILWFRSRLAENSNDQDKRLQLAQQQLQDSLVNQEQRLGKMTEQLTSGLTGFASILNERFTQNNMLNQQSQKNVAERLEVAGKTIADLKGQLGKLNEATQNIVRVGSEVRKLQDILQSPKLRGGLGEWSLENILADVLPQQNYHLQYPFKNGGRVDALVELANGKVCIDAKFPLSNFQAMMEAEDKAARSKLRKAFLRDVRNRIDEIARKYILPEEGTLDFALMYIPAENVYYETILADSQAESDLCQYARQKKVIPVSPNSLYAYLMVIATGLKGLQIEKNAQRIRQQISQVSQEMILFRNDFVLFGKHLKNANGKYDDADKKLNNFQNNLQKIAAGTKDDQSE